MIHPPAAITPELIRARDAAKMLAVSERTLSRLTREGKLPAVKLGHTIRFHLPDIHAFISRFKTTSVQDQVHV